MSDDGGLRLSSIVLPENASAARQMQRIAIGAQQTHGDVVADRALLYGLLSIVASLEVLAKSDASLRKAVQDIFPESV